MMSMKAIIRTFSGMMLRIREIIAELMISTAVTDMPMTKALARLVVTANAEQMARTIPNVALLYQNDSMKYEYPFEPVILPMVCSPCRQLIGVCRARR